jgi:hypothetical protein
VLSFDARWEVRELGSWGAGELGSWGEAKS